MQRKLLKMAHPQWVICIDDDLDGLQQCSFGVDEDWTFWFCDFFKTYTPLGLSSELKRDSIVRWLLSNGANANKACYAERETGFAVELSPLECGLRCKCSPVIMLMLLTAGSSIVGLNPKECCEGIVLENWLKALHWFEVSRWHGARDACVTLLCIKKFSSVFDLINRDVMRLIVRRVWRSRDCFIWFDANSRTNDRK